jgi:hypothetical protein
LEQNQVVFLPDGRIIVLPRAQVNQAPVYSQYVPTYAGQSSSQQGMLELQSILQSRHMAHGQMDDHQHQHQIPNPSATYQYPQMKLVQPFQDPFMQTETTDQPGSYNNAAPGFVRGSVPFVQRQVSAGSALDNCGGYQGYNNLRQNAQRVPHPDDGHRGRGSHGRRDFHSWASNRGQRMQNYVTQNYTGRQASTSDNWRAKSRSTSSTSTNDGNNQQKFSQVAPSQTSVTPHLNPGESSTNNQQQPFVYCNMAKTNQQHIPVMPVPVVDTNARRAFEEGLIQATLALQLEDAGTPNGNGVNDVTPRRPITDNTVTATAPPKLGHQAPALRSRKGQSMVGLNGSPIRRPSQPLIIDPIRGPPPAFYPKFTPPVVSTSTVPSTAPSVSELQHQSEASQSRATSVSTRSGEQRTAQRITFSLDQLVTPNQQHLVRTQVAQAASPQAQIAPYQMPPNQIAPWPAALYQAPGPVSRHLSIIAQGGRKPSMEVACDPQNFPFVELLSRAQPSNGNGVVRISNVSTPPFTIFTYETDMTI